jgi:hypothetical protein
VIAGLAVAFLLAAQLAVHAERIVAVVPMAALIVAAFGAVGLSVARDDSALASRPKSYLISTPQTGVTARTPKLMYLRAAYHVRGHLRLDAGP